jgi:hypothetical protein
MTVTDVITPDIAPLLPTDAIVQARGRVLAAELGRRSSSPGAAARPRPAPSMRSLAALGAVAAIAGVAALELSDGGLVSRAQAFPVFATPHVTPQVVADSILGSFLQSQGEVPGNPPNPSAPDGPFWRVAASHAYAFTTYWGTAYTFKNYDPATGYTVCTVYPDYQTTVIPYHAGWVGGCRTAPTLGQAAAGWETIPDPTGVEFVQLVPAGTTAQVTLGSEPAKAVPVHNGVLSVRVTSPATLAVHSGSSPETHHLDPGVPAQPGGRASSASGGGAPRGSHAASRP